MPFAIESTWNGPRRNLGLCVQDEGLKASRAYPALFPSEFSPSYLLDPLKGKIFFSSAKNPQILLTSPKLFNTKGPSCCEAEELHWLHSSTEHAQRNTLHTAPAQQFWNWYCRHHSPQISNTVMITPFVLRLCFPHFKVTDSPRVWPSSRPFFKKENVLPGSSILCSNSWCCLSVNDHAYSKLTICEIFRDKIYTPNN